MKIVHYSDITPTPYKSETAANALGRVCIGKDDGAKNFCMRVFELGTEGSSAHHKHDFEHEVFIHQGEGEVEIDGTISKVRPGIAIFIPPGAIHQLRNTGAQPLVFVCCIPAGYPEL